MRIIEFGEQCRRERVLRLAPRNAQTPVGLRDEHGHPAGRAAVALEEERADFQRLATRLAETGQRGRRHDVGIEEIVRRHRLRAPALGCRIIAHVPLPRALRPFERIGRIEAALILAHERIAHRDGRRADIRFAVHDRLAVRQGTQDVSARDSRAACGRTNHAADLREPPEVDTVGHQADRLHGRDRAGLDRLDTLRTFRDETGETRFDEIAVGDLARRICRPRPACLAHEGRAGLGMLVMHGGLVEEFVDIRRRREACIARGLRRPHRQPHASPLRMHHGIRHPMMAAARPGRRRPARIVRFENSAMPPFRRREIHIARQMSGRLRTERRRRRPHAVALPSGDLYLPEIGHPFPPRLEAERIDTHTLEAVEIRHTLVKPAQARIIPARGAPLGIPRAVDDRSREIARHAIHTERAVRRHAQRGPGRQALNSRDRAGRRERTRGRHIGRTTHRMRRPGKRTGHPRCHPSQFHRKPHRIVIARPLSLKPSTQAMRSPASVTYTPATSSP